MKFKDKSTSRRLALTVAQDTLSYIIGLTGLPFPISTFRQVKRIFRRNSPSNFVDWQFKDWQSYYEDELSNCLSLDYKNRSIRIPHAKVITNCDNRFPLAKFIFRISNDFFSLHPSVKGLTESSFEKLLNFLKKRKRFSNEINLRPTSITFVDGKYYINCDRVFYKDFVHTNLLLDAKNKGKSVTLRELIHDNRKLESISDSLLANHLGIEMLLFTSDGSIILQVRSSKVAFRQKELCAAASGALSASDILERHVISLNKLNKFRESFEEIGVGKEDLIPESVFCLGLTRDLIRGGKPELHLSAATSLSVRDIISRREEARDKWESKKIVSFHFGKLIFDDLNTSTDFHKFHSKVDEFLDKYIEHMSVDLLAAFSLWCELKTLNSRI